MGPITKDRLEMREKPLIHTIGIAIFVFTVGSGVFAACGDPRVQSQADSGGERSSMDSKNSKPNPVSNKGTAQPKSPDTSDVQASNQGLRHSTGDEGHVVGAAEKSRATAQSSTALLTAPDQATQLSQKTAIAGCAKSDYASDSGSTSDAAKTGSSERAKADCDQ